MRLGRISHTREAHHRAWPYSTIYAPERPHVEARCTCCRLLQLVTSPRYFVVIGRLRDECLNVNEFATLDEAREILRSWRMTTIIIVHTDR